MNLKSWIAGIAVLTLAANPAFAADLGQWSYGQVTPVSCDSCCDDSCCDDGCCDDSCCDDSCCDSDGCGCGVGGAGLLSGLGGGLVEGFSLADTLGINGIDIGGWTQFGYHDSYTPRSGAAVRGQGSAFNDVPKDVHLQQQWWYLGKEADGSCGVGFGFRADFVYGTDAQKTQSFGNPGDEFDNGYDRGVYGWAIPQLYGEVALGEDLSVKIGHFFTLVGYEVVGAPGNFFYSHALTMFNSEPFTHTGVLATYDGFEDMTLYGGWTLGWDTGFANANSGNNFLGGFSTGLGDSATLTYITTYGNFGARDLGQDDSYSHSIVLDVALTDNVNYVLQSDLVGIDALVGDGQTRAPITGNDQVGINQYLFYTYNDILTFGSRIEWWKSDGQSNFEYTSGVNVKLLDNLVMRPEFRKDWIPAMNFEQDMVACDMVLTY
ncbi:MAG: porin [Pirellulales bacterium]|nr:porin [Pirellulales bacterium]